MNTDVDKNLITTKADFLALYVFRIQGDPERFGRTILFSQAPMTEILPVSKIHSFTTV